MFAEMKDFLTNQLAEIKSGGLFKVERIITSPQGSSIYVNENQKVINLCSNNYLGLAAHPEVIHAAQESYKKWGFGLSSVRFICGTQKIHKELEVKISFFLHTEDTILYTSCFDANGGLFETLLTDEDAIISDELNHASIIDGVRLCKAQRYRYLNSDMNDLEDKLKKAQKQRFRIIVTDGVFSMDGYIANLKDICDLADKYDALVMVDDSHAVGFMGDRGRGTHEYNKVMDRVDIITGTLGKALGGASGGYTSGRKEIIDMLRQRSRPYLFSNSVAPSIVSASIKVIDILSSSDNLRNKLFENMTFFREEMVKAGFDLLQGDHPIIPIMLGDAKVAKEMADKMLKRGVYVIGFSFPVVPKGKARIRTQISAAHEKEDLKFAASQFAAVKEEMGV